MIGKASFVLLLVVEEELLGKNLEELVRGYGYRVITAVDYAEALVATRSRRVDLLLVDHLPAGAEEEALIAMREVRRSIGLILVGADEENVYVAAVEGGALDFVAEPVMARELELKIERARRESALRYRLSLIADFDEATGLEDGNAFFVHLSRELERAQRQKRPMHLAMLYLQDVEKEQLAEIGLILKSSIRSYVDHACRCTKREFALLLPETNADQAAEIVQRVLLQNLEKNFGEQPLAIGCVSCSIEKDEDLDDAEFRLIKKARMAMEESRAAGDYSVVFRR
ncbi:response regulator [Desulfotalea psychrophila]|uniref:Related to two-component system response regulator (Ntr family) n=1 Tax=Desulfotalea psychrophila (strain LSv54 / DSM 12343) TaxID=177439 RepID=Q6ARN6_DESPS|nr:response regulator [Desulfotalea psychrophila]CAG34989.1 related to two-component system response regulator (Ntr family) [Desulfotalea psychrophila LSv54]